MSLFQTAIVKFFLWFLVPAVRSSRAVNSDGTPSELYKRFRNPRESGAAVAAAIKHGYRSLYEMNE
jgi:hypothetical protein